MTKLEKIPAQEISEPLDQWLDTGRELASRRRNVDWEIADWLRTGHASGFIDQAGFDFLADSLGMAPKRLKDISKAATAFPPHMRDQSLSIEHHASLADVREPALKLEFLNRAKVNHWTPERLRHEVKDARPETDRTDGQWDDAALLERFIQHWNRLPRSVRMEAAELIADSHGGGIEL